LKNCAIRNAKNWSCKLSNKPQEDSYEWQLRDGQFEKRDLPFALTQLKEMCVTNRFALTRSSP